MSVMESHGSITVYTGPMFSGKTQALMARLRSKERAHKKVLVVKPELDDRFHSLAEIVSKQRTAQKFEKHASMAAYPIKSGLDLGPLIREFDPDVVGVDEAQFFDDSIGWVLDRIAHQSGAIIGDVEIPRTLEVYAAGLDLDAWAKPFGPMPNLLAFADRVEKFMANCFLCGQDARLTQKIGGSGGRIEVGADDLYEARCVACWTPPA
jgi:thymidine kinase